MLDDFENAVTSIMSRTKCDRAKAESVARLNGIRPSIQIDEQKRDDVLEKAEQWEVMKLFIAFGFKVDNLSQARRTKQAPGLPDLWCMHRDIAIAFWWETKRQVGGKLSDAQVDFRDACTRCHVGYGSGDRHAARTHLIKLGLARVVGDVIEPIRNEALACQ